ncbi:Tim10/DDP family zinc finger-domain-containing protein [Pterulicium gracile]|uniref:Mitochondrial import inner membrane translocase subunit n=1 Tax=Pterulicium gracile TaxID=1884261 RepID=A0A5C3QR14_9AGAR|nr:Tim10/DDP family zinc finger-domain-containing protein [Pterula gracilis]
MASFLGSSSTSPADMQSKKEMLMDSVRREIALQNAQELMNKANEKCFERCITKPGTALSGSEQTCLSRCLDRYMEAFNIVSKTYITRISQESAPQS